MGKEQGIIHLADHTEAIDALTEGFGVYAEVTAAGIGKNHDLIGVETIDLDIIRWETEGGMAVFNETSTSLGGSEE